MTLTLGTLLQIAGWLFAAGMVVQSVRGISKELSEFKTSVNQRVEDLSNKLDGLRDKMEEGNQAIHDVLNQHRERIASVEALWRGRQG